MKQLIIEEDWHGVQDAASDIREIEAELRGLSCSEPPDFPDSARARYKGETETASIYKGVGNE